jgi:hypothetical protein
MITTTCLMRPIDGDVGPGAPVLAEVGGAAVVGGVGGMAVVGGAPAAVVAGASGVAVVVVGRRARVVAGLLGVTDVVVVPADLDEPAQLAAATAAPTSTNARAGPRRVAPR